MGSDWHAKYDRSESKRVDERLPVPHGKKKRVRSDKRHFGIASYHHWAAAWTNKWFDTEQQRDQAFENLRRKHELTSDFTLEFRKVER